ncbi:MAG: hypothetical protein M3Z14_06250 [Candidatus Eremiobacteraeota bacterium]|nr:hypothetical protein [Candidatus Eremiobacteraeota bacterium]
MRWLLTAALVLMCFAHAVARGQLISLNVRDADLRDVVTLLAKQSGRNVVIDASAKPEKVTLYVHGVSFDEALAVLLRIQNLHVTREGNFLLIGSNGVTRRRSAGGDRVQVRHPLHANAPAAFRDNSSDFRVQRIALRHVKARDALKELRAVLPGGSYLVGEAENSLIITGNNAAQEMAQADVARIDIAKRQVMFEVRIADLKMTRAAADFAVQYGGGTGATFALAQNSTAIDARMQPLIASGNAQILTAQRLFTSEGREANLLIGQNYPVVFYDGRLGGQQVRVVEVGVKLWITPTLHSDGSVTTEMRSEYIAVQGTVAGYPILANRRIDAILRVQRNETVVLGGAMHDIDEQMVSKLPGLVDTPIFGTVFRSRQQHQKDEILVFITPHAVADAGRRRSR